ncbi:ABC transporter substrate-binding protein [Neptuniibacter caesariensis]|uniref:Probable periplasmic binding protein n=1 Tax=Neptuniibacter caesariensis TaxID=207954 RepID=A0A7U8C2V1_NEPCE|nr:ABC transporter substrate-binding protein [Neptuniibacter caesariensis]EAR60482.1 probable periplasmic binding protein [Oceanospirillum sp. MED92] [Neptuniibacter caesariensis]
MGFKKLMTAAALIAATLSAPAIAGDKIRIATEGAYAPFNMINADGELAGFDVDIAKALCEEMKADCKIVAQDWDGIIPGLKARKYDAIIASLSITPERSRVVSFTDHYYSNSLTFVTGKETSFDPKMVEGKVIGAQRATIAGQYLEDNLGDKATVKLYDTQDNAYIDLASGRLDAILSDKLPAYDWLQSKEGQAFEFRGEKIDIDDKIAIAVRKPDSELKEKFNKALKAIIDNGTYEKINAKYFPFSIY